MRGGDRGGGQLATAIAAILLALLTLLFALPAAAREAITSFSSAVTLNTDGSVDVIETIEVNAEGYEIRRGIYRDIPLILINPDNSRLRSDLTVKTVLRDGRAEPYSLDNIGAGFKRIRIGDADVLLSYGRHKYTIHYSMTRMGRSFADHDELFWNATGNYWNFPIDQAVASITLPKGAVIDRLVGYTGAPGSMEQAVTITRTSDNTAIFRVNRPLSSGEGVSVAASFQKGILAEPQGLDRLLYWLSDHRDIVVPGIAVGLVLLYNLLAWSAVGRDPKKGTIIPLFHPPKGFSPGLAEYVDGMGWEKSGWTAFTASIFDLGVKGLVKIDNPGKTLSVTVTGKAPPDDLGAAERLLFDYFKSQGKVTVNTTTGPKLNETRGQFVSAIETENRLVYFRNNTGYILVGVGFSLLILLGMVVFDLIDPITLVFAGAGALFLGILGGVLRGLWRSPILSKIIFAVWAVIFGGNLIGAGASFLGDFRIGEFRPDAALIGAASIIFVNVLFAVLMRAPTVQGRQVMDQLDGFKMYMNTAEKNRLNMTNEPPMTVERFERILPYAIALGVEKPWSEHFEAELARNAVADAEGSSYAPGFYTGRNWSNSSGGFANSVSSVASGMSAAMVAAQPSSSSGSGFSSGGGGGGGGSGGGGGGGGGGGW
ncbi:hypothetical protein ASC89_08745 [Devosia sp. Root413D1]|uniref:DUF2207 domain-containing protein n=1 Tax=Devosia sp. Root413D1 TaxID=1736531 RepID=UPI0006FE3A6F|nr:DUF2207 domain-containing protein [Devosia sp. Root413D1]KQW80175.1 hypothetical protein ASC89_08745 [Devosia sp. Root413D1]